MNRSGKIFYFFLMDYGNIGCFIRGEIFYKVVGFH